MTEYWLKLTINILDFFLVILLKTSVLSIICLECAQHFLLLHYPPFYCTHTIPHLKVKYSLRGQPKTFSIELKLLILFIWEEETRTVKAGRTENREGNGMALLLNLNERSTHKVSKLWSPSKLCFPRDSTLLLLRCLKRDSKGNSQIHPPLATLWAESWLEQQQKKGLKDKKKQQSPPVLSTRPFIVPDVTLD